MVVKVLYGFDTERPYGDAASTPEGMQEREKNLEFTAKMSELMTSGGVGRTFFMLGHYLEKSAEHLGSAHLRQVFRSDDPLVEIGQHTYSHCTIAPIRTRPDKSPVTPEELRIELEKANQVVQNVFLRQPKGLRTPLGYSHNEFSDNIEVLETIRNAGLTYVSSSLRDNNGGIRALLEEEGVVRQPFVYRNGLVEVPSHGWQDTAFTGSSKSQGVAGYPTTTESIFEHFTSLVDEASRISDRTNQDFYLGLCLHPWAVRRYDPNMDFMKRLIDHNNSKGIKSISYGQAHELVRASQA